MIPVVVAVLVFSFLSSLALGRSLDSVDYVEVLLEVKNSFTEDPRRAIHDWNSDSQEYCSWTGVACDRDSAVVALNLSSASLTGFLSPSLGRLIRLATLDLSSNRLTGTIPSQLGRLSATQLQNLVLQQNQLNGPIPPELGNLANLQILNLANNVLQGEIPSRLGELSSLSYLNLMSNQLKGTIPGSLGKLSGLRVLDLSMNELEGEFPAELAQLSELEYLVLSDNKLSGRLPENLCPNATKLGYLFLSTNNFSGPIPAGLAQCWSLTQLDLSNNSFTGDIPVELGDLTNLTDLLLNNNSLTGSIPREFGNLSILQTLTLYRNELRGRLPEEVGKLASLNVLNLAHNQFSGAIPASMGRLSKLYELRVSQNLFSGSIPVELGQLQELQSALDLSFNDLSGGIPLSLASLMKLEDLNLSHNSLTGEVPRQIGEMSSLVTLDLSRNDLQGQLDGRFSRWPPQSFAANRALCGRPLQPCGIASSTKRRSTLSSAAVVVVSVVGGLVILLLLVAAVTWIRRWHAKRSREVNRASSPIGHRQLITKGSMRRELTWKAIMEATCNLSHEFAIGSGGSGIVYRAELPTGETVTVKKILHNNRENLMLQENSFVREVKTLGRIRHRHLANLLGCLSSNHGEHLLIYEYMENGSLWDWLHKPEKSQKRNRELSWEARLRIAIGLAKGVEYLHHDCVPSILHRDIKSGNVLLDGDMEAHLGDFGLAKAAAESRGRDSTGNTESGTCFAGSYGYVAPGTSRTCYQAFKIAISTLSVSPSTKILVLHCVQSMLTSRRRRRRAMYTAWG
ncbi:LRR receptor-like serine threonine-protein kinase [Musa troglodytarum]|uniref:LRR receptor-like serine threonine-protein kinase n=1 Tax=Musa troglodytarum TaxID=320322 RepID=A0A9E7HLC2_9LILI|nr:LRR receptor-like serine threonine-protein kinase [Musa troglodytarum]